jgi:hypothetical protein
MDRGRSKGSGDSGAVIARGFRSAGRRSKEWPTGRSGVRPQLGSIGHVGAPREAPNVLFLMDDARSDNGTRKVKEWPWVRKVSGSPG